jgi:hypothetical protein
MSIVTIPSVEKGQENVITLSKSELAIQAKVVSDSYFSNQSNWKQVVLTYESDEGNQLKRVVFDAVESIPEGIFDLSDKSKDAFEVKSLTIFDYDGGYLKLYRGDLNTSQFDIVIESAVSGDFATWDIANALGPDTFISLPDGGIQMTSNGQFLSTVYTEEFIPAGEDGFIEHKIVNTSEHISVVVGFQSVNNFNGSYFNMYANTYITTGNTPQLASTQNAGPNLTLGQNISNGDVIKIARIGSLMYFYLNGVSLGYVNDPSNGAVLYPCALFAFQDTKVLEMKVQSIM